MRPCRVIRHLGRMQMQQGTRGEAWRGNATTPEYVHRLHRGIVSSAVHPSYISTHPTSITLVSRPTCQVMAQDFNPAAPASQPKPPTIVPLPNDPNASPEEASSSSSSGESTPAFALKQRIIAGLRGAETAITDDTDNGDATKNPSATPHDAWQYRKSIPTMVLYDEKGLRLYDAITEDAPEYYLFGAELGLFREHGGEIARAMGFPTPVERRRYDGEREEWKEGQRKKETEGEKVDERWGDAKVGKWNDGVNGESGGAVEGSAADMTSDGDAEWTKEDREQVERGWDIVELGAG